MTTDTKEVTTPGRRKLKVLVITMPGSERKAHIEAMFAHPTLAEQFEPPQFSDGVPSRGIRSRFTMLETCHRAGLVPDAEWEAIKAKQESLAGESHCPENFFDCLNQVPIGESRMGSENDVKLHYSVEFWRKAKTINRGRAVLGCTLAHLIALKRFTAEGFDVMLEDNVRTVTADAAERIWRAKEASEKQSDASGEPSHLRFLGWLGSIPNLEWILTRHVPKRALRVYDESAIDTSYSTCPFPRTEEIMEDLKENGDIEGSAARADTTADNGKGNQEDGQETAGPQKIHTKPGGTPVWGSYAYWMSAEGYEALLRRLQSDVGSLLWKGKRARYYNVKPADKVLPRLLMDAGLRVELSTYPAFYRAPMLTSKIHTAYDPEFCKSTQYQLSKCGGLKWEDLWLSDEEKEIVKHKNETGEWITLGKLKELKTS